MATVTDSFKESFLYDFEVNLIASLMVLVYIYLIKLYLQVLYNSVSWIIIESVTDFDRINEPIIKQKSSIVVKLV